MQTPVQDFDPAQVAYFEKAGWEAYYARHWGRAFLLMVQLNREQFRMSLITAISAAIDVVRASQAFAPLEGNDIPAATRFIRRYYQKARHSVGLEADANTLADLEMDYWKVHRRLAQQRKQAVQSGKTSKPEDLAPLVDSLANLHAALFQVPQAAARRSAELRSQAAVAVDRITGGYSENVVADWQEVEQKLFEAYTELK